MGITDSSIGSKGDVNLICRLDYNFRNLILSHKTFLKYVTSFAYHASLRAIYVFFLTIVSIVATATGSLF